MEISSNNLNSQNIAEIEENEKNVADGIERSQEQPTLTDNSAEKNERPAAVADFLNEEDSDEDDFIVTIGEIKTGLLPFQKQHGNRTGGANGNIDLDANPTLKDGTPIYDLDLAALEDKPWRKPGADLTDYFNYGFNEETWNKYCEMQRKFRQEFGTDQAAINKAILSNIQLSGAAQLGLNVYSGGRQLVNLLGAQDTTNKQQQQKVQKIVVDLSKPPPATYGSTSGIGENTNTIGNTIPLIRTVISETGITRQESSIDIFSANTSLHETGNTPTGSPSVKTPPPSLFSNNVTGSKINVIDFTKPPPNFDPAIPPPLPVANQAPTIQQTQQPAIIQQTNRVSVDLPPGMEEDGPPGVSDLAPAGVKMELPPSIPRMDFSQPPPINQFPFNPTQSSFTSTSSFGPGIHLSQHSTFSSRPPPLFQPSFRHQYGGFGNRFHDRYKGGRGTIMSRSDNRSSDSENDTMPSQRKRRRSRSKSRSPSSSSRRRKEEKRKDREHKDGKKKKDKDKKEKHKSSHRSPSAKKERSIKTERGSSEREKEEKESSSSLHRRLSPKRKEKDVSSKTEGLIKIKIERKTPIE